MPAKVVYVPKSSKKICQLTGAFDRERGVPAFNRTESRFGLAGTDLGASFEHKGRCYFLFGDTWPVGPNTEVRPRDGDSIAYTTDPFPDNGLNLTFLTAPDGKYLPPSAPGVKMAGFEVPTGGFSHNGHMYIFFTTDARPGAGGMDMNRSVLLRSDDDGYSFRSLYDVSIDKIINIAPVIVENTRWPGLPERLGKGLLLFCSGAKYRRSNVYLAYLPLDRAENRGALWYFMGKTADGKIPVWSRNEADATPLFDHPQVGELSASWNPFLRQWLLFYNAGKPRGINYRSSDTPWGVWSETAVLFEPWEDGGYGHFMHVNRQFARRDEVHDPGRENEWGGEYGPYIIERYTRGSKGKSTIYFVMSVWNPYNTVLMKTELELR